VYKISKLVDECWRYSKLKQCHLWAYLKRPIFGVRYSQGSAETVVKKGEIANYHLIAYSFSNISTKNCQNRLMCIKVIVCNVTVLFLRHSVHLLVTYHRGRAKTMNKYTLVQNAIASSPILQFVLTSDVKSLKYIMHLVCYRATPC